MPVLNERMSEMRVISTINRATIAISVLGAISMVLAMLDGFGVTNIGVSSWLGL